MANGEDIRFSTSAGVPLAYQIEEWNAAKGEASVWVRVPVIKGNERQELRVHWGKAGAASEWSEAVFNESNGYLSVWHMSGSISDEVGTLESKDVGTTATAGMIGSARHLAGKQGIFGGERIQTIRWVRVPIVRRCGCARRSRMVGQWPGATTRTRQGGDAFSKSTAREDGMLLLGRGCLHRRPPSDE